MLPTDHPSDIPPLTPVLIPQLGGAEPTCHLFDQESIDALCAAWATGRPLLVLGEPGIGKSQLARATAVALGRAFVSFVVESRSEARDLSYRFDAVSRLADAQIGGMGLESSIPGRGVLDPLHYIEPGPLWWALDWKSAHEQATRHLRPPLRDAATAGNPEGGTVLLIDEIDKADSDFANSLLDVLGNRRIVIPWIQQTIALNPSTPAPILIITSNGERELPAAFVRRCVVLELSLPDDTRNWLLRCANAHIQRWGYDSQDEDDVQSSVLELAVDLLLEHRRRARELGVRPPAVAEFIDLVRTAMVFKPKDLTAQDVLRRMAKFTLAKRSSEASSILHSPD